MGSCRAVAKANFTGFNSNKNMLSGAIRAIKTILARTGVNCFGAAFLVPRFAAQLTDFAPDWPAVAAKSNGFQFNRSWGFAKDLA